MFEAETYEAILQRMLDRMPKSMDTRESSFLYNAEAPVAMELMEMYIQLNNILNLTFFDTSDRYGKLQRCKERGIDLTQFDATKAIVLIQITPKELVIPAGTLFNLDKVNFEITEESGEEGVYYAQCTEAGVVGNVTGEVSPVNYIVGLENAVITDIFRYGEDEAPIEEIDRVYYDSLNAQAFGGNRADYLQKMHKIAGVGGVKVYTAEQWLGGGTVKLVFTTSAFTKPIDEFVDEIQTEIDPLVNQGAGLGLAPVGHTVTVKGVDEATVDISMELTLDVGYVWDDVKPYVESAVDSYFSEQNKDWENLTNIVIRRAQIESDVIRIAGIIDVANVTLNGISANLNLDADEIAIRGEINATIS